MLEVQNYDGRPRQDKKLIMKRALLRVEGLETDRDKLNGQGGAVETGAAKPGKVKAKEIYEVQGRTRAVDLAVVIRSPL